MRTNWKYMPVILAASLFLSGCGNILVHNPSSSAAQTVSTEELGSINETDLEGIVFGMENHYIVLNSRNIDYAHNIAYDKNVVRNFHTDAGAVDLTRIGKYKVVFTVTVSKAALDAAKGGGVATMADTDSAASSGAVAVIEKIYEVVSLERAQRLADQGIIVWDSGNATHPKSDGTIVAQEIIPADLIESEETELEEAPEEMDDGEEEHQHIWVDKKIHHNAETRTVHHDAETHKVEHEAEGHTETVTVTEAYDEPVYETITYYVCEECGYEFNGSDGLSEHQAETGHSGESTKTVSEQTGTEHHDAVTEEKWVVDKEAWIETVVDRAAYDETIVEREAWDETVTVCSVCGEER